MRSASVEGGFVNPPQRPRSGAAAASSCRTPRALKRHHIYRAATTTTWCEVAKRSACRRASWA
ncbi:hypothetical protein SORBI_3003G116850 [Sorghum bicolor]|uniref:Uncharacterized protein n=1 Tax=Sorghum bicolor TaxID=4558 RepID=A0A1W0VWW7_SORBI|nr:hypothetical protein SORBI_3003G116850 [Sorghum bicolor]